MCRSARARRGQRHAHPSGGASRRALPQANQPCALARCDDAVAVAVVRVICRGSACSAHRDSRQEHARALTLEWSGTPGCDRFKKEEVLTATPASLLKAAVAQLVWSSALSVLVNRMGRWMSVARWRRRIWFRGSSGGPQYIPCGCFLVSTNAVPVGPSCPQPTPAVANDICVGTGCNW